MPDFALTPRSGLEHVLLPGTHGAHRDAPGVVLTVRTNLALVLVMARKGKTEDLRRRVQDRYDLTLPLTAQRVEKSGFSFVWAGPERWLAGTSTQTPGRVRGDAANRVVGSRFGGEPDGWTLRFPGQWTESAGHARSRASDRHRSAGFRPRRYGVDAGRSYQRAFVAARSFACLPIRRAAEFCRQLLRVAAGGVGEIRRIGCSRLSFAWRGHSCT